MPRTKQFCEVKTLEKAVELFWNKGFHATSMQDLVEYLGINRASLYSTYGDKHGLFKKALHAYTCSNGDLLREMLAQEDNLLSGLHKMFSFISQTPEVFSAAPGCFVVNTAVEMLPNEPEYLKIIQDSKQVILDILSEFFTRTWPQEWAFSKEELQRKVYMTYTFQNGIQVMAKSENDPKRIQALIDDFLSLYE